MSGRGGDRPVIHSASAGASRPTASRFRGAWWRTVHQISGTVPQRGEDEHPPPGGCQPALARRQIAGALPGGDVLTPMLEGPCSLAHRRSDPPPENWRRRVWAPCRPPGDRPPPSRLPRGGCGQRHGHRREQAERRLATPGHGDPRDRRGGDRLPGRPNLWTTLRECAGPVFENGP